MENRKSIKFFILLLGIIFIIPVFVFAYSDITTHPALTDEIIDLFNQKYSNFKLSDNEKEIIKKGSKEEDIPPRWMQHFYDPVYNRGLILVREWEKSKDWSQDTLAQAEYDLSFVASFGSIFNKLFGSKTDYSWDRAIYEYAWGNKERGLESLGHTLHLLEDATVPDHTRNDVHLPFLNQGSPYEDWTRQFTDKNFNLANKLIEENKKPIIYSDINQYFNDNAIQSNNNFFSPDTILIEKYSKPKPIEENIENSNKQLYRFKYGKIQNKNYKLLLEKRILGSINVENSIEDPDNLILSDYWDILSEKAVLSGAGLVKLFFDEVEKEKQTKVLWEKNASFFEKFISKIKSIFSKTTDDNQSASVVYSDLMSSLMSSQDSILKEDKDDSALPVVLETQNLEENKKTTFDSSEFSQKNQQEENDSISMSAVSNFVSPQEIKPVSALPYPGFGGGSVASIVNTTNGSGSESLATTTSEEEIPADTTPPDISFSISECANSISSNSCLLISTNLNLSWRSAASDLDYFELTKNGVVSTTTATSTTIVVLDNSSNTFSIRAKDTTGNWSVYQTISVEISSAPIVINEIAWGGTPGHSSDEWIELYNKTSKTINLNNWVLFSQTDLKPYINLTSTIPANGYYLIERTDDNTISDVSADWYGSFGIVDGGGSGLVNTGEVLVLSYASTTIDQTPNSGSWSAGTDTGKTMERISADVSGSDSSNWGTNNTVIKNGKNVDNQEINGTPKARNSASYLINKNNQNISSNITLTKSNSPYLIDNVLMNIQLGATLTIEPGVVIKFYNDAGFSVYGKIVAQGTASEPIVFESFDENYWYGVDVFADGSIFNYVNFKKGGKYYAGQGQSQSNLFVKDFSATITNSIFEYSKVLGLKLQNSNSSVSNNIFRYNNNVLESGATGLNVSLGAPDIKNNTFLENKLGLNISNANLAKIDSNIFNSNSGNAVSSSGYLADFTNNSGSSNGANGIYISSGNISQAGATTTLKSNSFAYIFDKTITIPATSALIIQSGTSLKASGGIFGGKLDVYGNLSLEGENSGDIVFSSSSETPAKSDWYGVVANTGSMTNIRGATFSYAETAITYDDSEIHLENVKFDNNKLAVSADAESANRTITALMIDFLNNTATTSPGGLW